MDLPAPVLPGDGCGDAAPPHPASAPVPAPPPPLQPPAFVVPAAIALDVAAPGTGTTTAARVDLLLPQDADGAALAGLAVSLCGGAGNPLAGREGDVGAALAASLAPFTPAQTGPGASTRRLVALEFTAAAGGARLTDRVVVDLGAPAGAECAASLGAAVAGDAGLSDAVAAAYSAAFKAVLAAARAGRSEGVLPPEAAAGWVPRVERG